MIRAPLAALTAVLLTTTGCAPRPQQDTQVKADLKKLDNEQSPDKLLARGRMFASMGDLTRAEQYMASALERGGDPKTVLPLLLRVCVEARRYRAAIDYAEDELKKHPQDARLRFLVASLYVAIDEPKLARQHIETVLAAQPGDAEAHYVLAVLLRDQNDLVGADHHFREYLRLDPHGSHADEARGSLLKSVP